MRMRLLNCLARAVVKHGGRFLFSLAPGGEVIYDIATEVWGTYCTTDQADSVRPELEALAQASADQVRQLVADAVHEVAAGMSAQIQEALHTYLTQVPSSIRRSLRRPSDPSGKSVPANVSVRGAEDLVSFLPARMPRFKPGDRPLPGVDWELEELAGIGGFGEVWKAHHAFLKSKPPVALKFCLDNSAAAALRNEAGVLDCVMQQGKHAGIVPLLHTYLTADPPCLEYEFVEGGDLTGLIQEMHTGRTIKPEVANRLLLRLAEIVAFAHKAEPPIVHGDLKPANVLVRRTPDGRLGLRVIDFGIGGLAAARAAQETRKPTRSRPALLTEAVRGAHTPLYASPQQMARRLGERADPRDDVHALGVIWLQLLTGDLGMMSIPSDWREQLVERGVGEALVRLLGACIAPKAEKRPASAVVLVEQINAANVPMVEPAVADALVNVKADRLRRAPPPMVSPAPPRKPKTADAPQARPAVANRLADAQELKPIVTKAEPPVPAPVPPVPEDKAKGLAKADTKRLRKAKRLANKPAIALLVTGILILVASLLNMSIAWKNYGDVKFLLSLITAVGVGVTAVAAGVAVFSGFSMMQLRRYRVCMVGSIVVMPLVVFLPIVAWLLGGGLDRWPMLYSVPIGLVSLPIGLWSLMTLQRPGMRSAFELNEELRPDESIAALDEM
jgi:serine/threonine protein kinase